MPRSASAPEAVAVVASVAEQFACRRQNGQEQGRAFVVAHLPFGEQQHDRATLLVTDGVQLGVQTALGSSDMVLWTPAVSIIDSSGVAMRSFLSVVQS